jgi:hypothetical protein
MVVIPNSRWQLRCPPWKNPNCEKSRTSPFAEFSDLDPFFALTQNLNYKSAKVKTYLVMFA